MGFTTNLCFDYIQGVDNKLRFLCIILILEDWIFNNLCWHLASKLGIMGADLEVHGIHGAIILLLKN